MKKKNYPLYEVKSFGDFRELLSSAAAEAGQKTAFRFEEGEESASVSYAALFEDVTALGSALTMAGLLGAHTAVWAKNGYPYITAMLTVLASPGVFLPIDAEMPVSDGMEILRSGDTRVVFLDREIYDANRKTLARLETVKRFIVFDLPEEEAEGRFLS